MKIDLGVNPYLKAKYLYQLKDKSEGMAFFFDSIASIGGVEETFNVPVLAVEDSRFLTQTSNQVREFCTELALVVSPHDGIENDQLDFGRLMLALKAIIPTSDWLRILKFSDLRNLENAILLKDKLLQAAKSLLEEGWIVLDERSFYTNGNHSMMGRSYFDTWIFEKEYNEKLAGLPNELFAYYAALTEFEPQINDLEFWGKIEEESPIRIAEIAIHLVFGNFQASNKMLASLISEMKMFGPFTTATIRSLNFILQHGNQNLIPEIPKYAGYLEVDDPSHWIKILISLFEGEGTEQEFALLGNRSGWKLRTYPA